MNKIVLATAAMAMMSGSLFAQDIKVTWQTLGNKPYEQSTYYTQRFTVESDKPFARLAFNQFAKSMRCDNPADTLIEIIPGYYAIASPRFAKMRPGEKVTVDVLTGGSLRIVAYTPDGVHAVSAAGKPLKTSFKRLPITNNREQWADAKGDYMPYGGKIFDRNVALKADTVASAYDIIPSYKSVKLTGGMSPVPQQLEFIPIKPERADWYSITIKNGRGVLECAPESRRQIERRFLRNTIGRGYTTIPNAVIEDYPDAEYRALMIDVVRNYLQPSELYRIIELMADYGFNMLHFHCSDDEAWRLEMPSLPELTSYGSRRGYTTDEKDFLAQIYNGNGDPNAKGLTSNGYFSRHDFIAMLQHADSLGIQVLPEIESPGHARAAIKSMEKRYRDTDDASYRLIDLADTSKFTSAQAYHDCVMNPALPGPYKFMETVVKDLIELYREAGVRLPAVHIGGDEVPSGAWSGSPVAQKYMSDTGIKSEKALHAHFVERVCDICANLGVKISGWEEIANGHSEEFDRHILPNVYSVNFWHPAPRDGSESLATKAARKGYPVVLCNADLFYMDMVYSYHPEERGLYWASPVDEFKSMSGYLPKLCEGKALGASGNLFGETLRSDSQAESYLLPKMLGLAERAWNGGETYSDSKLQLLIDKFEIPYWTSRGYNYHLRQPGIKIADGVVTMNSPYSGGEIRYTLDGSNPTASSPIYTEPITTDAKQVRAIITLNDKQSVVTIANR
jgi:hexosaminidase